MTSEPALIRYPNPDALARELATRVAHALQAALSARGAASLVVSGGRSPIKFFEALTERTLDWSRVHIGMVDERWVDASDKDSNEKLIRDHLLQGNAAAAQFSGLKNAAATPELGAAAASQTLQRLPRPVDVVILGMGDDGHTASLFPGSPGLDAAIDSSHAPAYVPMRAPSAPQMRLSMNLSALLDSRQIILSINGDAKMNVFTAANSPGPAAAMPVRTVLRQQLTPVAVIWSP